jgi:hypothetical protein
VLINCTAAHANAQKLHNDNLRGTGDVPASVIDYQLEKAMSAPKLATVNEQKRGDSMENPTVTSDAMSIQNAKGIFLLQFSFYGSFSLGLFLWVFFYGSLCNLCL